MLGGGDQQQGIGGVQREASQPQDVRGWGQQGGVQSVQGGHDGGVQRGALQPQDVRGWGQQGGGHYVQPVQGAHVDSERDEGYEGPPSALKGGRKFKVIQKVIP